MLVYAYRLRRHGAKIAPEELRKEQPLLGHLSFRKSPYDNRDDRGYMWCLLTPRQGECGWCVELYSARVLRIETRGILIGGTEEVWERKRCYKHPQVLWAWAAGPGSPSSPGPGSKLGALRLAEAIAGVV